MKYDEYQAQDARLVILRELSQQPDGRLNEALMERVLDTFGYLRSREWIRTQLCKLEELGAVSLDQAGTVLVASITRAGLDHVERRSAIDGIKRPSPAA